MTDPVMAYLAECVESVPAVSPFRALLPRFIGPLLPDMDQAEFVVWLEGGGSTS